MNKNIEDIRRELEDKAEQTDPYDEIDEKQLKKAIYNNAGMSDRTVRRYKNKMEELGIIQEFNLPGDEQDVQLYKVDKRRMDERDQPELTGSKKSVYLSVDEGVLDKAEALNLNKSALLEKAVMNQVSSFEDMINRKIPEQVSSDEADFIYEMIMHDCYLDGTKDSLRRELYIEHFDTWNDIDCQNLRRMAADLAEDLGMLQAPEGL